MHGTIHFLKQITLPVEQEESEMLNLRRAHILFTGLLLVRSALASGCSHHRMGFSWHPDYVARCSYVFPGRFLGGGCFLGSSRLFCGFSICNGKFFHNLLGGSDPFDGFLRATCGSDFLCSYGGLGHGFPHHFFL